MEFPGTWVNHSRTLIYRVVPKCACSTIGQILFHADHGHFFDGDIHDCKVGLWKWNGNAERDRARQIIADTVRSGEAYTFTCVRNPYTRILSAFFDKVCGIQRNGNKYRGDMVPMICEHYDMQIGAYDPESQTFGEFDQIGAFRKFLLFVRDTIKFRHPMHADIHWSPMAGHASTLVRNGGRYHAVFATESFNDGMKGVLGKVHLAHRTDLDGLPRFNVSEGHGPRRAHPVADYFDDLGVHIVQDIYRKDFAVFGYDRDPGSAAPAAPLAAEEVNARLAR